MQQPQAACFCTRVACPGFKNRPGIGHPPASNHELPALVRGLCVRLRVLEFRCERARLAPPEPARDCQSALRIGRRPPAFLASGPSVVCAVYPARPPMVRSCRLLKAIVVCHNGTGTLELRMRGFGATRRYTDQRKLLLPSSSQPPSVVLTVDVQVVAVACGARAAALVLAALVAVAVRLRQAESSGAGRGGGGARVSGAPSAVVWPRCARSCALASSGRCWAVASEASYQHAASGSC